MDGSGQHVVATSTSPFDPIGRHPPAFHVAAAKPVSATIKTLV
jgi:hypothetical protein